MSNERVAELEAEVARIGAARAEANDQWQKWAAEATKLQAEVARLRADLHCCADVGRRMEAERDRLRAVLAETPENIEAVVAALWDEKAMTPSEGQDVMLAMLPGLRLALAKDAAKVLAALRAKVGLP